MSVYAVWSLFVSQMAVAMSSCRCKAFIQYFMLMYQCGTCSELKEQREESKEEGVEEVQGILSTVYWINLSFKNWVVQSSTFCMKVSGELFLLEEECVGRSNSSRISSIVSRSSITSVSDTPFSGKVGSAG
jgi:hypothetical protein